MKQSPRKARVIDCHEHTGLMHDLAWKIYQRWNWTGVELEDLAGEVYLFMERCARRYNPDLINPDTGKPYAWSTYIVAAAMKCQAAIVAQAMGEKRSKNQQNLRSRVKARELDAPVMGDDKLRHAAMVEASIERDLVGDTLAVREAMAFMARCRPVMADVVYYRFVRGETLMQVARRVGLSRGRVQQIHHEALAMLREAAKDGRCPHFRDWGGC